MRQKALSPLVAVLLGCAVLAAAAHAETDEEARAKTLAAAKAAAAKPAAGTSFNERVVECNGVGNVAPIFGVVHPSHIVFAARDITRADNHINGQYRVVKMGEPLMVSHEYAGWVTAITIDAQYVELQPEDFAFLPLSRGLVFPTVDELHIFLPNGSGQNEPVSAPAVSESGIGLEKVPGPLATLIAGSPKREAFMELRNTFTGCYAKEMEKVDPQNKRKKFTQETYDRKTGQTVKMESLEAVLDRKVCKVCKCEAFSRKRVEFLSSVMGPMQQEKYESMKPGMAHLKSLFAPAAK